MGRLPCQVPSILALEAILLTLVILAQRGTEWATQPVKHMTAVVDQRMVQDLAMTLLTAHPNILRNPLKALTPTIRGAHIMVMGMEPLELLLEPELEQQHSPLEKVIRQTGSQRSI